MKTLKRVIACATLLTLLAFPASAFASGKSSGYEADGNKGLLASISSLFSFFGGSSGKDKKEDTYDYDKHYNDKKSGKGGLWDWLHDRSWWDDFSWWKQHEGDSWKLWEKYYCY
ncbi:hypothetical protein D3P07_07855 [Paenibacillus sp. 1011MAR3C5]|uniref:hypothetical protein n=1 Tax=Paenibacillus sp. 1011MAR3C5 TaxID=1675787 RepID=UPI000E6CFD15|nr:hypothetical protein [Paenibacillus sp. 1011MAR3C5]RJE90122.1 hypothetical protein D3P07_07855 [Paenibacillus sp. 1011MAR3C5]